MAGSFFETICLQQSGCFFRAFWLLVASTGESKGGIVKGTLRKYHVELWNGAITLLGIFLACCGLSSVAKAQLPSALTAFHDFSSGKEGHHVIYQTYYGHLYDLYYLYSTQHWDSSLISYGVNAAGITGFSDGFNNHVFVINADQYYGPNSAYPSNNYVGLTEFYGSTIPADGRSDLTGNAVFTGPRISPAGTVAGCGQYNYCITLPSSITGFWDGQVEHVFYEGTDSHIHEVYHYHGTWWDHPIGGVTAASYNGQGLTSVWDGSVEHVFYIGYLDKHVHELYFNGQWWPNDWTNWGHLSNVPFATYLTSSYDGQTSTTAVLGSSFFGQGYFSNQLVQFVNGPSGFQAGYLSLPNSPNQIVSFDVSNMDHCPTQEPPQDCKPVSHRETYYLSDYAEGAHVYQIIGSTVTEIAPNYNPSYCNASGQFPPAYSANQNSPLAGFYDGTQRHVFFLSGLNVMELVAPASGNNWTLNDLSCLAINQGPPAAAS
jgi:hypothetical protein